MNDSFQKKVEKVFQDFADFTVGPRAFDHEEENVYCKLISKKIILLIQVPSS